MCLIIDASVAGDAFVVPANQDAHPVMEWVEKGGTIIFGGKLTQELYKISNARRLLTQYARAGRAKVIADAVIDAEIARIKAIAAPKSNDVHVLGLARASGARLLYSSDDSLIEDFKDKRFIKEPRGKVYKTAKNKALLGRKSKC